MLFAERCVYDQLQAFVLKHGMVIRIHFAVWEFLFGFLTAFRNQIRDGGNFVVFQCLGAFQSFHVNTPSAPALSDNSDFDFLHFFSPG